MASKCFASVNIKNIYIYIYQKPVEVDGVSIF